MKRKLLLMVLGVGLIFSTQAQTWTSSGNNHTTGRLALGTGVSTLNTLHVFGSSSQNLIKVENSLNSDAGIEFESNLANFKIGAGIGSGTNSFTIYDLNASQIRMMINSSGQVGIGTTSPISGYKLDVNGKVNMNGFYSTGTSYNSGNLYIYGTSYAYSHSTISDQRFKKNIKEDFSAFQKLYDVKTYQYQYKDFNPEQDQYGVMAQELTEIFPEMVNGTEEDGYSVNYTAMIPLLIRAMQDQKQTIEALSSELAELKEKVLDNPNLAEALDIVPDGMDIFPNPANNTTNIALKGGNKGNITIEVVNLNGEVVKEIKNSASKSVQINTAELLKGVYFVRYMREGKLIETKRLLVQK